MIANLADGAVASRPYDLPKSDSFTSRLDIGASERDREAVAQYEQRLLAKPSLLADLPELNGKVLGCWCAPKACHGDVLLRLANATDDVATS